MRNRNDTRQAHFVERRSGWLAAAALALVALTPSAVSADEASVRTGQNIFTAKAACQACHGWAADGTKMDNQMPDGANLRETTLDREGLIEVIRCGRPGRDMPAFERNPYSDGRCYGMKMSDIRAADLTLTDPAATLNMGEIEAVADFLFAKVIGKGPMTKEKCVEFWGQPMRVCDGLR